MAKRKVLEVKEHEPSRNRILNGESPAPVQTCTRCGCTEAKACTGGCSWALPTLCTSCVDYHD